MIRRPLLQPNAPQGVDLTPQFGQPQFMDIQHAQPSQGNSDMGSAIGTGLGAILTKLETKPSVAQRSVDAPMPEMLPRKRRFPMVGGGDVA